jgi:Clostripain family
MPPANAAKAKKRKAKKKQGQWTVMVFMGANTEQGNTPMFDAAHDDLQEMANVGSGGPLKLYVQIHGQGIPQRGRIKPTKNLVLQDVPPAERNPAGGLALGSFIRWALQEARHKPEKEDHHTMLVLWGHAYNFGIGHAETRQGTVDALDYDELSRVLKHLQGQFLSAANGEKRKLDILGFDACDIAGVELACQFEPFAKYLLGSEIGVPIPGWPYDRILHRLKHPFGGNLMNALQLGKFVVARYCEAYTAAARIVSLTLLDLERVPELRARAEVLADTLAESIDRGTVGRDQIASLFVQSQTGVDKPFVDVADLCLNLVRWSCDPVVMEAARSLGDFLISPDIPNDGAIRGPLLDPFVVNHGRNASQTARLNGISLYAPHVAPINDADATRIFYEKLTFSQVARWSELVNDLRDSS